MKARSNELEAAVATGVECADGIGHLSQGAEAVDLR
jgi:hypothetical protein